MKTTLVVLGLLLAGCGGGPDFSGSYAGSLSRAFTCSDGSGSNQPISVEWSISNSGDGLRIVPVGGGCGDLLADLNGDTATFKQKTCPSVMAGGVSSTETITGGSLSVGERSVSVSLTSSMQFSGAFSGTCGVVGTGTLSEKAAQ